VPDIEERIAWVNYYDDFVGNCGSAHTTRESADIWRKGRIACVKQTFVPGEGLEGDELAAVEAKYVRA